MAKRRVNGEGTIYKRASDGRWVGRIWLEDGRWKYVYARTQAGALEKLGTVKGRRDKGDDVTIPERLTVESFLRRWLEIKALKLRPETFRRYREACELYLIPELGKRKLVRLTAPEVEAAYGRIRLTGNGGRGLSGTTMALIHGVLKTAMRYAFRNNQIAGDVTAKVDAPRRSTGGTLSLTRTEAIRLLTAAEDDRLEALYVVAITCGLRVGELQALRWRDIDFDDRVLRVMHTLQGVKDGKPILAQPKTARSRREIRLPVLALESLRRHRTGQLEERVAAGGKWIDEELVFTNKRGGPLDGNNFRQRAFRRLLERAGLPPMRFHDLRHTHATLELSRGVNLKTVSERLGHSDVSTTLRIYTHVQAEMQQHAADVMDEMFRVPREAQQVSS